RSRRRADASPARGGAAGRRPSCPPCATGGSAARSRSARGCSGLRSRSRPGIVARSGPMSTAPLPPVERVRPGVWSVPVPMPDSPLRYVLVYAFETDGGLYLIDAGWNTDEAFETLAAGLVSLGASMADVRGVMITH